MDKIKFKIETTIEKEDYRKFLYIATFCRNKIVIPMIAAIALIGSLLINWNSCRLNWIALIITWVFLFVLAIVVICFKVERKNKLRITTDNTGTFGSITILNFYYDKVVMENKSLKSTIELKYNQFFGIMECKDYFIFYLTANQASLIRKKDVNNLNEFKEFIVETFENKYKYI